jgi:hypothetical protein
LLGPVNTPLMLAAIDVPPWRIARPTADQPAAVKSGQKNAHDSFRISPSRFGCVPRPEEAKMFDEEFLIIADLLRAAKV